jgi:exosortase/archaeosortase family protein
MISTKRFLIVFALIFPPLFGLLYWEFSPFANPINDMQTRITLALLDPMLHPSSLQDHTIITPVNFHIIINKACNGIVPLLIYFALIWSYRRGIVDKVVWSVVGYGVVTLANTLRIWLVTKAVEYERESFEIAHDFFGNILLIATVLLLFVTFIKITKRITQNNLN